MNLLLISLIAAAIGYGLIIKKDKLLVIILSSYLAFVLLYFLGTPAINLFSFTKAHPDLAKTLLFLFFWLIFCFWAEFMAAFPNKKGLAGHFFNLLYGFLAACLILTLLLALLTPALQKKLFQKADLLTSLYRLKNLWITLPLVLMVVSGFLKAKKKKKK